MPMNDDDRNIDKHPSYALLSFSRVSAGSDVPLFGSSITHRELIRMSVKPAYVERSLHSDWYMPDGRDYLEVEMSYSQFAEAITAMNQGSGVPVTLIRLNNEKVPSPDFKNKGKLYEEEIKDKMENLGAELKALVEESTDILTNKKSINKGDRQTILNQINRLSQEIQSNIPFIMKTFNEQMDKTVQESKGEVEAFTQAKLNQLGIEKLEELKSLGVNPDVQKIEQKSDE